MTSFAFILGVVPLVIAEGAGAEMRRIAGHGRLQRHARRDALRHLPDAGVLLRHPVVRWRKDGSKSSAAGRESPRAGREWLRRCRSRSAPITDSRATHGFPGSQIVAAM